MTHERTLQVWEKMEGEPSRWFDRFYRFLELGPQRTVEAVWRQEIDPSGKQRKSEKAPGDWHTTAREWQWRERADAWDVEQRQKAREANARALAKARERHIKMGKALQKRARDCIANINPADLTVSEALRLIELGRTMELEGLQATHLDVIQESLRSVEKRLRDQQRGGAQRRQRTSDSEPS